jgi:hypothetical protein
MSKRPTDEQIARARKWLDLGKLVEMRRQHAITADMVEVLLAATMQTPSYVLLFAADSDKFVSAHYAPNRHHAYGFTHGVKAVSLRHRVYMWPRDRQFVEKQEVAAEVKRACIAMTADKSRRAKEAKPKSKRSATQQRLTESDRSPCCSAEWLWEQIGGMQVYRTVDGRKVYRVKCNKCSRGYEVDGGEGAADSG